MITAKKLIKLARKWQKMATLRRKRISSARISESASSKVPRTSLVAGHFVVYTTDHKRFTFPIAYLNNFIFRELFRMSEEEFGLPNDGPITLPCDAVTMEYVISLVQRCPDGDTERALLVSLASGRCSFAHSLHEEQNNKQFLLCGF